MNSPKHSLVDATLVPSEPLTAPFYVDSPASAPLLKGDDRWTLIGDSITQDGSYSAWLHLYFATRFPGLSFDLFNCGISGDSAGGALRRYDWDIQPAQPTLATVMFGMNDVERDYYTAQPATPEMLARRAGALAAYRDNLTQLVSRLRKDGARVVLVTPSPFDETVDVECPRQTGVNGAIAECACFMKQLAAESGAGLIDLHGPMTALNLRLQANDPKFTLTGPDRVHPGDPGNFVMAYFFLKAINAPGVVSQIELDAKTARIVVANNAKVGDFCRDNDDLAFTVHAAALPYPIDRGVAPALAWVPFQEELNRESLRVTGLAPGSYVLSIDGRRIREFTSNELAVGVNLALEVDTPQALQAAAVLALVKQWRTEVAEAKRVVAQTEHWHLRDLPHPVILESARPILESKLADPNTTPYDRMTMERYLDVKQAEAVTAAKTATLVDRIRDAARPIPHSYRIAQTR